MNIGQRIFCFIVCLLLMVAVPIIHDHKVIGITVSEPSENQKIETLTTDYDGRLYINTTDIGKNITGYAGPTPVLITVYNGKIESIEPLSNQETPEFLGAVMNSDMLESLDGKTLSEAAATHIDGISGATYTSNGLIENIRTGINFALFNEDAIGARKATVSSSAGLDLKFFIVLLVILSGATIPFFLKNKKYRYIQLALNVGILGFWGGTYLSYSMMVGCITNGLLKVSLIPIALMLIVAFVFPMFGRTDHYCNWLCPYGSIQDIAGKLCPWKIRISPKVAKILNAFRRWLWIVLMWLLITGLYSDWMDYEPFAAFMFTNASMAVLIIAGAFLVLSFFVGRPYCRFVCPTGSLFKYAEGHTR